eukprot:900866_1
MIPKMENMIEMKLEENIVKVKENIMLSLSNNGRFCCIAGGEGTKYFYVIDIDNKQQYPMEQSDAYSPCFINGKNKYISIGDKNGRIQIWEIELDDEKKSDIKPIKIIKQKI